MVPVQDWVQDWVKGSAGPKMRFPDLDSPMLSTRSGTRMVCLDCACPRLRSQIAASQIAAPVPDGVQDGVGAQADRASSHREMQADFGHRLG